MNRFRYILGLLLLTLVYQLRAQEKADSVIIIELDAYWTDEHGNRIIWPPVVDDMDFYGYYDENFNASRKKTSGSLYVLLAFEETKKAGVMDVRIYDQLKKSRQKPDNSHFRVPPVFDSFKLERGGIASGKIDDKKYIFNRELKPLVDAPIKNHEVLYIQDSESLVVIKDSSGASVYTNSGKNISGKKYRSIELRGDYLQCKTQGDSIDIKNLSGRQVIPTFKSDSFYISPEGVVTFRSDTEELVTYIDLNTADTIAWVPVGYRHRGNFTAIKKGQYWELIDRKGKTVSVPFVEIERVQLFIKNRVALLRRENYDNGNKYAFSILDLQSGESGPIKVPDAYSSYDIVSSVNTLTASMDLLLVNIREMEDDWNRRTVAPEKSFSALVSMDGTMYPKSGKYHQVRLLTSKSRLPFLKVGNYTVKENGQKSYLYGLTDLNGDVLVAPKFEDVTLITEGVKVSISGKFGLFDLTGRELIPATLNNREFSLELNKIRKNK